MLQTTFFTYQAIIWCWNIINWTLRNKLQDFHRNSNIFSQGMCLKMSSAKWRPLCLGLNVSTPSLKESFSLRCVFPPLDLTEPLNFLGRRILSMHYYDVIMTTMASQITSLTVVYSIVYSGADQRKQHSSASLAFVRGIHRDRWIPRTKGQ